MVSSLRSSKYPIVMSLPLTKANRMTLKPSLFPVSRNRLLQALQMAVLDLEEGHAPDPFRYVDYNLQDPSFLDRLEANLRRGTFRPSPPQELTFPKSEFAIRPGRRIELEDLVAVYYCLIGLSRDLEDKLKFGVVAYRIKRGNPPRVVQGATLILPKYMRKQLRLIYPWYTAWPSFIGRLRKEYLRRGRRLIGVSDITSFYEDVDLGLLRNILRTRVRKENRPLANFLIEMYQDWSARDVYFVRQNRGIPQGTNSSGVVVNYYLMPFDEALDAFARRKSLRWYRYNDDMRLLGGNREDIRLGLRAIGQHLASLNLIQQGSKTKILSGRDARVELFDNRPDKILAITSRVLKAKKLSPRSRRSIIRKLDALLSGLRVSDKSDSKVLAMLYTAYGQIGSDRLLPRWKQDYLREPTRTKGILGYLSRFLGRPGQCRALITMLKRQRHIATDWELAQFLRVSRRMRHLPTEAVGVFRSITHSISANWLVRQQAILTIGWFHLKSEARALGRLLDSEWDDEVRRAIITVLFLLDTQTEKQLLIRSSRDLATKVARMSNYSLKLRVDPQLAQSSLKQFKNPNEVFFADSFWRLYQIRWNTEKNTRLLLLKVLELGLKEFQGRYLKLHLRNCLREPVLPAE